MSVRVLTLAAVLAGLFMAPAVMAQNLLGKPAPEFNASECVNEPRARTLAECKYEVVLIKLWGIG
jgi:hypothetical protein